MDFRESPGDIGDVLEDLDGHDPVAHPGGERQGRRLAEDEEATCATPAAAALEPAVSTMPGSRSSPMRRPSSRLSAASSPGEVTRSPADVEKRIAGAGVEQPTGDRRCDLAAGAS